MSLTPETVTGIPAISRTHTMPRSTPATTQTNVIITTFNQTRSTSPDGASQSPATSTATMVQTTTQSSTAENRPLTTATPDTSLSTLGKSTSMATSSNIYSNDGAKHRAILNRGKQTLDYTYSRHEPVHTWKKHKRDHGKSKRNQILNQSSNIYSNNGADHHTILNRSKQTPDYSHPRHEPVHTWKKHKLDHGNSKRNQILNQPNPEHCNGLHSPKHMSLSTLGRSTSVTTATQTTTKSTTSAIPSAAMTTASTAMVATPQNTYTTISQTSETLPSTPVVTASPDPQNTTMSRTNTTTAFTKTVTLQAGPRFLAHMKMKLKVVDGISNDDIIEFIEALFREQLLRGASYTINVTQFQKRAH
ncbi:cell wall protein DAN4-like [Syngnathus acus]|uniref:cell wall protein DAN4-like n=1 Tax=Syngnathus acus TaxID=161584 RepID=UPI0018860F93|nr:cell wall protein DAN4-like [Syngnathus acus]